MTNALDFLIRLKTLGKGGWGLSPRRMRDSLLAEHMGPQMHAKLSRVNRAAAKRKRGPGL